MTAALIRDLNDRSESRSAVQNTVKEINNLLKLLSEVTFSKMNRSANKDAHELAKLGSSVVGVSCMFGSVPPGHAYCNQILSSFLINIK